MKKKSEKKKYKVSPLLVIWVLFLLWPLFLVGYLLRFYDIIFKKNKKDPFPYDFSY